MMITVNKFLNNFIVLANTLPKLFHPEERQRKRIAEIEF